MASLAARLKNVQVPVAAEEDTNDFTHLTMAQLDDMEMNFGKAHLGKKFLTMWTEEQQWISWFSSRYANSRDPKHRLMIHYITRKVDRAEMTGEKIPVKEPSQSVNPKITKGYVPPRPKSQPKAKASPDQQLLNLLEEDEDFGFEEVNMDQQSQSSEVMESRMLNMESLLQHLMLTLENMQMQQQESGQMPRSNQ